MGKDTGFLEYERKVSTADEPKDRIKHFKEFHIMLSIEEQRDQAARCMDCGVPFCQYGDAIKGMTSGCPLNNMIPEWNDLLYKGRLEEAYRRLKKTSNFPEFTSRVCPALCEKACTCGLNGDPVSTRENEKTIIEYAYEHDLVQPRIPENITGKKVAVIGSGPAGLAVADDLNLRGHKVTVYERADKAGGLLRYGIPNMKLEKWVIDRRLSIMEEEGITFMTGVEVGKDIKKEELLKEYDAVIFTTGSRNPRDIKAPGREGKGIYFAVDYLTAVTKSLDGDGKASQITAKDKNVVIIGGGDTGNDCVGSAVRQGAKSVIQLEMMPCPPEKRREDNPWPEWPLVLKTDYGQEEAAAVFGHDPRVYQTTVKEYKTDKKGNLKSLITVELKPEKDEKTGRTVMAEREGSEKEVPCDMVLIAAGFLGTEKALSDAFGWEVDSRTNIGTKAGSHATSLEKVFAAGDARTGQSLVVKAIADGKKCAAEVDTYLMGYTNL